VRGHIDKDTNATAMGPTSCKKGERAFPLMQVIGNASCKEKDTGLKESSISKDAL
jgi:hypothetical protein